MREAGSVEPPFRSPGESSGTSTTVQNCPGQNPGGWAVMTPHQALGTLGDGRDTASGFSGQASLQRGQPSPLHLGRVCQLPNLGCRHREARQSRYCLCFHVHSASISRGNSLTFFAEHPSGLLGELGEAGLVEWLAVPHCWSSCEPWGSRSEDGLLQKSAQSSQVYRDNLTVLQGNSPLPPQ